MEPVPAAAVPAAMPAAGPAAPALAPKKPRAKPAGPKVVDFYFELGVQAPAALDALDEGAGRIFKKRAPRQKKEPGDEPELAGMAAGDATQPMRDERRAAGDYSLKAALGGGDEMPAAFSSSSRPAKKAKTPLANVLELGTQAVANGIVGDKAEPLLEMVDSSSMLRAGDDAALWRRYAEDGYLLFRNVRSAARRIAFERRARSFCAPRGVFRPSKNFGGISRPDWRSPAVGRRRPFGDRSRRTPRPRRG